MYNGVAYLEGLIWYSESGVKPNTLVAFDPQSHQFKTWPIPWGGGVVRNMVATKDGKLYLAESGVYKVAVVDVLRRGWRFHLKFLCERISAQT